jgi:hypothetical protein
MSERIKRLTFTRPMVQLGSLFLLLVFIFGCTSSRSKIDRAIIGEWKSNKELTVRTLTYPPTAEKASIEKLEALFGRLTVTYSKSKMKAVLPAMNDQPKWVYESDYKIVGRDENSIVIRAHDPLENGPKDRRITFEGENRYWIELGHLSGREYFDRLK